MSIKIFYDEIEFRLKGWRKVIKLIEKVIRKERKISGDLSFIITSNETVRKLNIQFLNHDYDTDVIAFNYNEGKVVNGEVYINIEAVAKNAIDYNVDLDNEVFRVLVHGILHLVGYDDKGQEKREEMRRMEDHWMKEMDI